MKNEKKLLNKIKLSKPLKITLITVVAVLVILLILILVKSLISKNSSSLETYTVRQETYEDVIDIAGNISAANEQQLQAQGDGTVTAVYVKEGDSVKKGQIILQLDDSTQQYNLASQDYQIAQKKINGSALEIKLMQQQREALYQKVLDRKVTATFDGVIAELDAKVGDYLEAKDSVGTLVDLTYLKATVEVAETDVTRLKVNQKVDFTFPAYSGGDVEGYLYSYPAIGEITSRGVTVVNAEVRIDNYPSEILPNFSFTGKIQISDPVTMLVVERNAIGHEGGEAYVEVINKDGSSTKKSVKVKPYGTGYVSIEEGLEGGECLKALSKSSISGRFKSNKAASSNKSSGNNQGGPGGGGPGGMGGGFGGPPGM